MADGFWITTYSLGGGRAIGDRFHPNQTKAEARAERMNKRKSASNYTWTAMFVVPWVATTLIDGGTNG